MSKKFILSFTLIFLLVGLTTFMQAANPTPGPLNPPNYNYTEANSCTACHFSLGVGGNHMLEAVGVTFNSTANAFSLTGNGWFAARHSTSNYGSTQNTFCAKCHSPIEAAPQATFNDGIFENTSLIPDGQVEGVTCASCHLSHNAAAVAGTRIGIYKYGMDKNTLAAYQPLTEGNFDLLCLNCHVQRHNEDNAAFARMYSAGVECVDCHMAPYGYNLNSDGTQGTLVKHFHDFKVADNLPYSCGVQGSLSGFQCHPEFSTNSTLQLIPYLKQQHSAWWPLNPGGSGKRAKDARPKTADDYLALWQQLESQVKNK